MDESKVNAFSERLLQILNHGALSLMISIGHRTGIFDAMSNLGLATSEEVAAKAGLNERYVREWLGSMVTAGIITVDSTSTHYSLPQEHAASLTRAAAADNLAVFTQYIAMMGSLEDEIMECFTKGGGVPYEKFGRFHAIMAEDSGQSVLSSLESHILPLVPGLTDRLAKGISVLDVGCGSGRIMNRLAGLFPESSFVGIDLSMEAIETARKAASERSLSNIKFIQSDLSDFDQTAEPEAYDLITTFDAIHDQSRPKNVLRGIYRSLKADGVYLMQDIRGSSYVYNNIDHPIGTFLYAISTMHCMTVSLAQGGLGLGAMWGHEKALEMLNEAGFRKVLVRELPHDIQNSYYVAHLN